ncbi:MAG: flagellar biosynthesis protein FlhF [Methylococcaceae bacterium]
MKIKRFFAADIRQAMRMVKDELGPDAVIMSNKSVDGGVEIVAARDFDEQVLQRKMSAELDDHLEAPKAAKKSFDLPDYAAEKDRLHIVSSPRKKDANNEAPRPVRREIDSYLGYAEKAILNRPDVRRADAPVKPAVRKAAPEPIEDVNLSDAHYLASRSRTNDVTMQSTSTASEFASEAAQRRSIGEDLLSEMRKEFKQLKLSMAAGLSEANFANTLQSNPVRLDLLNRLAAMGISKRLSLKLTNRLGAHTSADFAFEKALGMMAKALPISDDNILEEGGVIALVGPTGVGKTTTIAKLAAKFILKHGARQVALITTDNYRIAAHEQLNTYGRILDVPVRSAANAQELRSLINGFFDKKLILIDTAGMGQRDMRLAEQLIALQKNDIPVKSYLVMSATTQYKAMKSIINAFQIVEPTACIITKMDEAESKGAVISVLIEQQLPLSFITDGQQVPEDIHVPRAQRLIEQCMAEVESEHEDHAAMGYEDWVATGYA